MSIHIIIPSIQVEQTAQQARIAEVYLTWRAGEAETNEQFEIENIRFEHNEDWRNGGLSVQRLRTWMTQ